MIDKECKMAMSGSNPSKAPTSELATKEEMTAFFKEVKEFLAALKEAKKKFDQIQAEQPMSPRTAKEEAMASQLNVFIAQFEAIKVKEGSAPDTRANIKQATDWINILRVLLQSVLKVQPVSDLILGVRDPEEEAAVNRLLNKLKEEKKEEKKDTKATPTAPSVASSATKLWSNPEPKKETAPAAEHTKGNFPR